MGSGRGATRRGLQKQYAFKSGSKWLIYPYQTSDSHYLGPTPTSPGFPLFDYSSGGSRIYRITHVTRRRDPLKVDFVLRSWRSRQVAQAFHQSRPAVVHAGRLLTPISWRRSVILLTRGQLHQRGSAELVVNAISAAELLRVDHLARLRLTVLWRKPTWHRRLKRGARSRRPPWRSGSLLALRGHRAAYHRDLPDEGSPRHEVPVGKYADHTIPPRVRSRTAFSRVKRPDLGNTQAAYVDPWKRAPESSTCGFSG